MSIEQIITPREAPLVGGMTVRRILPFRARRKIGPFTFLDEMGPVEVQPGVAGDVPPHPHIGLSTMTYLFEGEFVHRDSLGIVQTIIPGDVNWMTAGKGVVHSERLSPTFREKRGKLHGLQAWVALPLEAEETEPSFVHVKRDEIPQFKVDCVEINLIAGEAYGRRSPVPTSSKLFYFTARMPEKSICTFDPEQQDAAFYLLSGEVEVDDQKLKGPLLIVFHTGTEIRFTAKSECFGVFLGGEPLEGQRHIYWNFVSSSKERIEEAKKSWRKQTFPKIPGETEFVPLPE